MYIAQRPGKPLSTNFQLFARNLLAVPPTDFLEINKLQIRTQRSQKPFYTSFHLDQTIFRQILFCSALNRLFFRTERISDSNSASPITPRWYAILAKKFIKSNLLCQVHTAQVYLKHWSPQLLWHTSYRHEHAFRATIGRWHYQNSSVMVWSRILFSCIEISGWAHHITRDRKNRFN